MRTRDLALACGTMMSIMAAGAVAQQERPRPAQPNTPTTQQPTNAETFRSLNQPSTTTSRTTSTNQPLLLKDLEGVWRVEVSVNPEHWKMHHGKMDATKMNQPGRTNDQDRDNLDRNDPNRNDPNRNDTDRDNTDRNDRDRTDPTQPRDPKLNDLNPTDNTPPDPDNPNRIKDPFKRTTDNDQLGAAGKDMKSFVGYAETKLVLGNNILQQSMVLPDMMNEGEGRTPQRIDGSPTTPSSPSTAMGGDMFRGMSFIGFDSDNQEYSIVFMDSRSGRIHCDTGRYDESGRRLVFHGKSDHMDAGANRDLNRDANRDANRDINRDANRDMKTAHGGQDVRVVLEVLSPTQHRVTMYQGGVPDASMRPTPAANTPAGQPNDDANRRGLQPGQPTDRNLGSNQGTIIYRATYTRASNEDSPRYQRLIREPGDTTPGRDALRPSTDDGTRPTDPATPGQPRRDR